MTENRISGAMVTVLVIRLAQEPVAETVAALAEQIRTSPGFYRNAPVLLEVTAATGLRSAEDFRAAREAVRQVGLVPVGIQGGSPTQRSAAMVAGLPSFPASARAVGGKAESARAEKSDEAQAPSRAAGRKKAEAEAAPAASAHVNEGGATRLVTQHVRSGAQIYAEGGDLIVLGSVSAGAEVIADGHIHVYGTLRGRALAGARGDTAARIFCRALEAELVSVAGQYLVQEDIPQALQGRSASVLIEGDRLTVQEQ